MSALKKLTAAALLVAATGGTALVFFRKDDGGDKPASSQKPTYGDATTRRLESPDAYRKPVFGLNQSERGVTMATDAGDSRWTTKKGTKPKVGVASPAFTPPPDDESRYDESALTSAEVTHVIADGDTLPALAARYLGDAARAQEIFDLNRTALTSPDVLPIGVALKMPPKQQPNTQRWPAATEESPALAPIPRDQLRPAPN